MIVDIRDAESRQPLAGPSRSGRITAAAVAAALLAGLLAAVAGPVTIAVAAGIGLFGLVAWRPVLATYLYLATLPFIAGMERSMLFPLVRPNEALLILVIGGAAAGGYVRAIKGAPLRLHLGPLDMTLAAFFLLATAWPLTSMLLRGVSPAADDVMATLPVCKLVGLFILLRATVRTPTQVLWCIRLIIGGAVGVSAIALAQSLEIGPVHALLNTWYPAGPEGLDRATTTLSNAIATGDYILIGLTLLVTCRGRGLVGGRTQVAAGLVLVAGVLAVGQFSTLVGAIIVGALLVRRLPRVRVSALRLAPIWGLAVLVGAPALVRRLGEFSSVGFPARSWAVRWDNVTHLYLPELLENGRFLIGVSPNSVKVPPDIWREVVYLESGYLQFLWIGGVPLLAGFVMLSWVVLRSAGRLGSRTDGVGACASALVISWWVVVFLLVLDAHLFMRGPGDLIFALLGIVAARAAEERIDDATD